MGWNDCEMKLNALWNYAIRGTSDPATAGHMHVVLSPIVYLIFAIIVMVPLFLIDVFRTILSKRGYVRRNLWPIKSCGVTFRFSIWTGR